MSLGPVSRCDFCGAFAVMWVDVHGCNMANVFHREPMRKDCRRCGAHHSLGPANDAPAAVAVEVRAAELAASLTRLGSILAWQFNPHEWDEERRGWSIAETNMQEHSSAWHAGYLARAIATHDTEEGET